jgi:hypothetical protein
MSFVVVGSAVPDEPVGAAVVVDGSMLVLVSGVVSPVVADGS